MVFVYLLSRKLQTKFELLAGEHSGGQAADRQDIFLRSWQRPKTEPKESAYWTCIYKMATLNE